MHNPEMWDWDALPFTTNNGQWMLKELPRASSIAITRGGALRDVSVRRHQHAHDRCVFTLNGVGHMLCGGVPFELRAGTTLFIPANMPHSVKFEKGWVGMEIGGRDIP